MLSQAYPRARCVEASDGRGALELLFASAFDLILLDVCMPGVGGIEVLKQVRHRWPETPVLAMSSCPESLFGDRCRKYGASGYLTKHLAPELLGEAVTRVLAGGTYFNPAQARPVGARTRRGPPRGRPDGRIR